MRLVIIGALAMLTIGQAWPQSSSRSYRTETPSNPSAWGTLGTMAGQYWILLGSETKFYVRYRWEDKGRMLAYTGFDSAGRALAGQYTIDPVTAQVAGVHVSSGQVLKSKLVIDPSSYTEYFQLDGKSLRHVYRRVNDTSFQMAVEILRGNEWSRLTASSYELVTSDIVEALGWEPQKENAASTADAAAREEVFNSSPSFAERLGKAVQDGAVSGVQDGVHNRVQNAISPPPR